MRLDQRQCSLFGILPICHKWRQRTNLVFAWYLMRNIMPSGKGIHRLFSNSNRVLVQNIRQPKQSNPRRHHHHQTQHFCLHSRTRCCRGETVAAGSKNALSSASRMAAGVTISCRSRSPPSCNDTQKHKTRRVRNKKQNIKIEPYAIKHTFAHILIHSFLQTDMHTYKKS